MDVALVWLELRSMSPDSAECGSYLFTPPASGDTITA